MFSPLTTHLATGLGKLEEKSVLDTMTKEVVGINLPKIAVTRSATERLDVAVSEIGNTVGTFGVGALLNWGLSKAFKNVNGEQATKWAVLGKSGAIYSAIFSLMWAMPFIRNYITAKRTGSTTFTQVIGAHGNQAPQNDPNLQASLANYKQKIGTILGVGATGAALATGFGLAGARKQWGLGMLKHLVDNPKTHSALLLKNGSFSDFGGLKAVLFWGLPAYGGWIHASRDPYERKEQLLKFATFVLGFYGTKFAINPYFEKQFQKLTHTPISGYPDHTLKNMGFVSFDQDFTHAKIKDALKAAQPEAAKTALKNLNKLWLKCNLGKLASSIVLLGTLPPLLNIYLTKKRLRQAQPTPARPPASQTVPSSQIQRKSFTQWGQAASRL